MKRALRLNRESLTELGGDELRSVAGGTHVGCATHGQTCDFCVTIPFNQCFAIVTLDPTCLFQTSACTTGPTT